MNSPSEYFSFGPFRLDVSARALYRGDEFVPVTPKALDTLFVLVEQAGKLVSKDELMQRVWPDAFVEEGSIANNISMLRKILNPHFDGDGPIDTVARRGYRFTAPVTFKKRRVAAPQPIESGPQPPPARPPAYFDPAETRGFDTTAVVKAIPAMGVPKSSNWPAAIAAAVLLLAASVGILFAMRSSIVAPLPIIRRSVAVLPMKNLSGDASQQWLSTALAETISAELSGANQFRVVSGENVVRMQQDLAPPMGVGLTRRQLDDIGSDLGADLILSGNYLVVSGKLRVDVRLDEVATGDSIASASITDTLDHFLDIVTKAGSDLRAALKLDQPPTEDATAMRAAFTATPDALRQYFEGLDALRLRDGPRSRDLLLKAIEEDDHFALAHSALSQSWRLLGYDTRGAESAKRALDLSSRLSREDRIAVEAQYHEATASWSKAIELYQQLWKLYPDNVEYGLKLGNAQWLGGKAGDTLKTVDELRKMPERDSRDSRIDLLEASAADSQGDLVRAAASAARAADKAVAARANLMLARARLKQGIYAQRANRRDEAPHYLKEAESLFSTLGDAGGVADAVRWQGAMAVDAGRPDDARAAFERAYKIVAPLNYIRLATELQILLADNARQRGDRASAIALAEQAITAAREGEYRSAEARALVTLGASLRLQGDFTRAIDAYKQSAEISGAIGETRNQNSAISNSAVIDFLTGDLKTARQKFESVLVFDRQNGNNVNLALRLNNLSRVLMLQDELVEAEKMNAEECRLQEAIKSPSAIAWCRTRLAEIWIEQGKKVDAEALAKQIAIGDFGSAVAAPVYYARFARLQLALGHLDQAVAAIEAAEKVQAKSGIVEEQAIHISAIRAEVETSQGKRVAAIARLQKAIADANKRGLVTWSLDARLVLSRLDPREAAATEGAAHDAGFVFIARKAHQIPQKQS